jgi:S-(hydroxymethyl)glutathione dehydrogenase/alcohol dehydrogenase
MAKEFGATHTVNASEGDPVAAAMAVNGRGADVAFEVIGLGATMEQAINTARAGGQVILVGVPRMDVILNLNAAFTWLYLAKTIKGCWYGSSNVHRDVPKLLELWRKGELKLKELISKEIDRRPRQRGLRRHAGRHRGPLGDRRTSTRRLTVSRANDRAGATPR